MGAHHVSFWACGKAICGSVEQGDGRSWTCVSNSLLCRQDLGAEPEEGRLVPGCTPFHHPLLPSSHFTLEGKGSQRGEGDGPRLPQTACSPPPHIPQSGFWGTLLVSENVWSLWEGRLGEKVGGQWKEGRRCAPTCLAVPHSGHKTWGAGLTPCVVIGLGLLNVPISLAREQGRGTTDQN